MAQSEANSPSRQERSNEGEEQFLHLKEKMSDANDKNASQRKTRPGLVTLIAFFQFTKGVFLLLVAVLYWAFPDFNWGSLALWGAVYVASNGGGRPGFLTLVTAIYAVVVGWGLWNLKRWARNILMFTSGMTSFMWIRYLSMNWMVRGTELSRHIHTLKPGFEQQSVSALIVVDALVFCMLAFHPDSAEAFRTKD